MVVLIWYNVRSLNEMPLVHLECTIEIDHIMFIIREFTVDFPHVILEH